MKSILTKKGLFLALVAVMVLATGCIKEDLDECYKLTLKVVNHKGDDITALSVVSEAKLFITIIIRSCLTRAISTMPLSEAKKLSS